MTRQKALLWMLRCLRLSVAPLTLTATMTASNGIAYGRDPEPQFQGITRQAYDTSCGLAALSTLLRSWLGDSSATEAELAREWRRLPISIGRDIVIDRGLRRRDLEAIAKGRQLSADWKVLRQEDVATLVLDRPVIALIQRPGTGTNHFTVIKAIRPGMIYLADSMDGHVAVPRDEFFNSWLNDNGEGLILEVSRPDRKALRNSPLLVKFDMEGRSIARHILLSEALLRRGRVRSEGELVLTIGFARSKAVPIDGQLTDGTKLRQTNQTTTTMLGVDYGLTADTTLKARLPYQSTVDTLTLGSSGASSRSSAVGSASVGIATSLQPESDAGLPAIILDVGADLPARGQQASGMNIGLSLQQSTGRFTWVGSVNYDRRLQRAGEGAARDVLSAGLEVSALLSDRVSVFVAGSSSLIRSEHDASRFKTITFGGAFQMLSTVAIQASAFRTIESNQRGIGISVSYTFD